MKWYRICLVLFQLYNCGQAVYYLPRYLARTPVNPITIVFFMLGIVFSITTMVALFRDRLRLMLAMVISVMVLRSMYYPFGWLGSENPLASMIGHGVGIAMYAIVHIVYIVLMKKRISRTLPVEGIHDFPESPMAER